MDWKEATGDDTLLDLVHEGREKGEQGSESPSRKWRKINESMFPKLRAAVLTGHTALDIL
jgi:hypothetical protein